VKSFLNKNKMKKLLLLTIVLFLSSFTISIEHKEAYAQDKIMSKMYLDVRAETYRADGMTYRVFVGTLDPKSVDIEVVNVTKEKLEVEKLKLEIARLKKENRNSGY